MGHEAAREMAGRGKTDSASWMALIWRSDNNYLVLTIQGWTIMDLDAWRLGTRTFERVT
jgi:hypothetical protein